MILSNRSFHKWFLIFGGIYVSSRVFVAKVYYPSILRYVLPPSSPASLIILDTIDEEDNNSSSIIPKHLQRRNSVTHLFNKTIYNHNYFLKQKLQSSSRLLQLISNSILVYRGYKVLNELNINDNSISNGIESFSNYNNKQFNNLVDCINIKLGSLIIDTSILIIYKNYFPDSIIMIIHHLITIFGSITVLYSQIGGKTLLYTLWWAEISADFLTLSWYARNIISNIENMLKFFNKKSVQNELKITYNIDNNDNRNDNENINKTKKIIKNCETVLLLSFSGLFLFARIYKYTKVLPFSIKHAMTSELWNNKPIAKYFAVSSLSAVLGLSYYWGIKIVLKIVPFVVTGKVNVAEYSTNR